MKETNIATKDDWAEARQARLNEVGTEPPCPRCGRARVKRTDYTRCILCGLNWIEGEDLSADPRIARFRKVVRDAEKAAKTGSQDAL